MSISSTQSANLGEPPKNMALLKNEWVTWHEG